LLFFGQLKCINALRNMPEAPVWQRNYYEHIIRNDEALTRVRTYIKSNPQHRAEDGENPLRKTPD